MCAAAISIASGVYASVPLYRIFCQQTGFSGTPRRISDSSEHKFPTAVHGAAPVRVVFEADVSPKMAWKFEPGQRAVTVVPGQTALAFFRARNNSPREMVGIATYSVLPAKAARYFNKIQCFCFEEQHLGPGEEVDMPVFFYLDPEFALDPAMERVPEIILGYTFFESDQ